MIADGFIHALGKIEVDILTKKRTPNWRLTAIAELIIEWKPTVKYLDARFQDEFFFKQITAVVDKTAAEISALSLVMSTPNRKHGEVDYFLTQLLSGHEDFQYNLHKIGRARSPYYVFCDELSLELRKMHNERIPNYQNLIHKSPGKNLMFRELIH